MNASCYNGGNAKGERKALRVTLLLPRGATAVRQSGLLPRGDAKSDGGFPKEELPLA
ncbi:hypothetical protein [Dendronalium sp. ChiSLP03b]|uniref:hypothetical protein n=1 Tax=Dendronalium sp. ChiSLP03b TaxID=3075381 RepID=UPI00391AEF7E